MIKYIFNYNFSIETGNIYILFMKFNVKYREQKFVIKFSDFIFNQFHFLPIMFIYITYE